MTDSDLCGCETASGSPCQHKGTYDDGRCYHHTDHEDNKSVGRPSKLSESDEKEILELASDGFSKTKIAESVGTSLATLNRYLNKNTNFNKRFEGALSYDKYVPYKYTERGDEGKTLTECSYCGELTQVMNCRLIQHDSHYCNEECHRLDQFKDGSRDYRGPNWRTQREKALDRDDYDCQSCGVSQADHVDKYGYGLHVHHIVPRRHFEDDNPEQNALENLITLCHGCHGTYEGSLLSPVDTSELSDDPIATKTP